MKLNIDIDSDFLEIIGSFFDSTDLFDFAGALWFIYDTHSLYIVIQMIGDGNM